ncbi:MAG: UDP-glucose/GDP-mannose dehydrogenase family protein [Candidatus Hydrogenedentes bacterium]|nr:UDP-glucose/GDP-mannose dehydrogenase family protein [Candidatus Hydrogenedentota bacterium]
MKIAVVGTGYVGLVSGACFSEMGHDVICVDVDADKIKALEAGRIPIFEPGLEELVKTNVTQGRLSFTTSLQRAVEKSLVILIAVGTPSQQDGTADLKYVMAVAKSIGEHMNGYRIIVDKSTVPVGTAAKVRHTVQAELDRRKADCQFDVVSNPEFLKEGSAIDDFLHPDRVVIGCDDVRTTVLMKELYGSFARDARPILTMSTRSAEMTKYAANAMLAAKISFINEIANICEKVGADVDDVRNGIGADSRIGYQFIYPGIGYGGSCFPKDVKALIHTALEVKCPSRLLDAIDGVNERQKHSLLDKMRTYYRDQLQGKRFALWGLSFKPETDDVREAPALVMITELLDAGATICAYDPKAAHETQRAVGARDGLTYADNYYDALHNADALIVATEWSFFRNPDFDRMRTSMAVPVIFDGRNIYPPVLMRHYGFDYFSIGREPVLAYSSARP